MGHVLDFAERAVKISSVLGALGYLSLRAHFNYLGVSTAGSLPLERYLVETYLLVLKTFVPLLVLVVVVIIFLAPLFILFALGKRRSGTMIERVWSIVKKALCGPFVPLAIGMTTLAVSIVLRDTFIDYAKQHDVVVGPLNEGLLRSLSNTNKGTVLYMFLWFLCLFVYTTYSIAHRYFGELAGAVGGVTKILWYGILASIVVLGSQLPILYGRALHGMEYARVSLKIDKSFEPLCGLLLFDTSDSLGIWHAGGGFGEVRLVNRHAIVFMSTEKLVNILDAATLAARDKTAIAPGCDKRQSSGGF